MSDDVIKNPNRANQRVQTPYEPEYLRKGIVPLPAPGSEISSLDGNTIDEDGFMSNIDDGHIIDNNEYVNFGFDSKPTSRQVKQEQSAKVGSVEKADDSPNIGDYILMVHGKLVLSGPIDVIESQVKAIMYGDDKSFSGIEVSIDDLVVLKRVDIKVGIFVDR